MKEGSMNTAFTIIPRFLRDPQAFYQSVERHEGLRAKAISLYASSVLFLATYGFVTGLSHGWLQALSTAVKMPLLFLFTLAFTLPALYFFALALLGIQFSAAQAGIVVLAGVGVTAFLLLGLSPITLFFVLTSSHYPFFQLLAVVFVAISGLTGLYYILRGFAWVERSNELTGGPIGRTLLRAWVILYGFVGSQMTWRLSPLVGDPQSPFVLLQPSRNNFFVDVINAFQQAFGLSLRSRSGSTQIVGTFMCSGLMALLALGVGLWWGTRHRRSDGAPHEPLSQQVGQ